MHLTDNQKSVLFPTHLYANRAALNVKNGPEAETGMTLHGEPQIQQNQPNVYLNQVLMSIHILQHLIIHTNGFF